MIAAVVHIYRDKVAIEHGLQELGDCVGKLDRIFMFITLIILLLIWLGIFGISITSYFVAAGSILIASSVMIGSSAKALFESIIFIFGNHPYDHGDKIEVDGVTYTVKRMALMSTVLHRSDGTEVYVPNVIMANKFIFNIRRSPHQSDVVTLHVALKTPEHKLKALDERMTLFLLSHPRDFQPRLDLRLIDMDVPTDTETQGKICVKLSINYRNNFQDMARRAQRRNAFMFALKDALVDLNICAKIPDGKDVMG